MWVQDLLCVIFKYILPVFYFSLKIYLKSNISSHRYNQKISKKPLPSFSKGSDYISQSQECKIPRIVSMAHTWFLVHCLCPFVLVYLGKPQYHSYLVREYLIHTNGKKNKTRGIEGFGYNLSDCN